MAVLIAVAAEAGEAEWESGWTTRGRGRGGRSDQVDVVAVAAEVIEVAEVAVVGVAVVVVALVPWPQRWWWTMR